MRTKTYYRHMTPMAAKAIRDLYFIGKFKQRELAHGFSLRQSSVSRIVSGQVWL